MALDFPANPTSGQVYGSYVFNATVGAWKSSEEQAAVVVNSSTAPTSANPGDLWFNTNLGVLFNYYSDGTSSQWVEVISSSVLDISSKASIASPIFTGNVTLPSTTSIGTVSSTEIGYVDGVTSAIQTQLNSKAPIASPVFTTSASAPQIINSGFDLILGNGDQVSRGDSGSSRAMVKIGTSRLYLNYASDFSGGTVVDSALAVNGRLTVPNQPSFFAYATGGVWAAQVWIANATLSNNGGHYNTSNGRFTAPIAGKYHFSMNSIGNTSGTTRLYPRINGNSPLSGFQFRTANGGNYGDGSFSWIFHLNANDYVDIYLGEGYNYSDASGYANWTGFLIG